MKKIFLMLCISILLVSCSKQAQQEVTCERPALGFAFYPGVFFSEDVTRYLQLYEEHSDLMTLHFGDKVPWETFAQCEFVDTCKVDDPQTQEAINEFRDLMRHLALHAAQHKGELYISVSPLNNDRTGVADSFDSEAQRGFTPPGESLSDPEIRDLYTKYVKYLVAKLQPDYLSQGVEVNVYLKNNPEDFKHLVTLMQKVYAQTNVRTKVIGPSIQWEFWRRYFKKQELRDMLAEWSKMGEGFALSTYPNLFDATYNPNGYFDFEFYGIGLDDQEPFFIAEAGVNEKEQVSFLEGLFALQDKHNLKGITWFFLEDADKRFAQLPQEYPYTVFQNSGLYDDHTGNLVQKTAGSFWLEKKESCSIGPLTQN